MWRKEPVVYFFWSSCWDAGAARREGSLGGKGVPAGIAFPGASAAVGREEP